MSAGTLNKCGGYWLSGVDSMANKNDNRLSLNALTNEQSDNAVE
ncbi:hypothetical protein NBRC116493_32440 [Aurantivibrio infirmus]